MLEINIYYQSPVKALASIQGRQLVCVCVCVELQ